LRLRNRRAYNRPIPPGPVRPRASEGRASVSQWPMFLAGLGLGAVAAALVAWWVTRSSGKRRSEYLSALSHDLRAPISSITAYAEILQDGDGADPGQRRRFLEIIHAEARRLDELIGRRLDGRAPTGGPPSPVPAVARASSPGRGHTILVVDDDEFINEATRTMLSREGFRAVGAAGGPEALLQARAQRPDLILMDRTMPEMSGDEALRRLRADPATRQIPVIITSGAGAGLTEAGAAAVLTKPISRETLVSAIMAALAPVAARETKEGGA